MRKVQLHFLCGYFGWNTGFVKVSWASVISLCRTNFPAVCKQYFVSIHLSMERGVWRLTRNTAQIELSKERHSNFKSSHFKSICLVSIGSSAQHIYITFLLLLSQLTTSQNTPGREVFLSHSASEEAIPQNIEQLSKVTEQTRRSTIVQGHWANNPNSCAVCSLHMYAVKEIFFLTGKKTILFWIKNNFCF